MERTMVLIALLQLTALTSVGCSTTPIKPAEPTAMDQLLISNAIDHGARQG